MADELEYKIGEELNEGIKIVNIFGQKVQKMEGQYEYDLDKGEKLPSTLMNIGATSGVASIEDAEEMIMTGKRSQKVFLMPNSDTMNVTYKVKVDLPLRDPSKETNVVPGLHTTLISIAKLADVDYVTMFGKDSVKVYNKKTTKFKITEKAA